MAASEPRAYALGFRDRKTGVDTVEQDRSPENGTERPPLIVVDETGVRVPTDACPFCGEELPTVEIKKPAPSAGVPATAEADNASSGRP